LRYRKDRRGSMVGVEYAGRKEQKRFKAEDLRQRNRLASNIQSTRFLGYAGRRARDSERERRASARFARNDSWTIEGRSCRRNRKRCCGRFGMRWWKPTPSMMR